MKRQARFEFDYTVIGTQSGHSGSEAAALWGPAIGVAGPRKPRQAAAEGSVKQGTDLSRIGMYAQDGDWGLD